MAAPSIPSIKTPFSDKASGSGISWPWLKWFTDLDKSVRAIINGAFSGSFGALASGTNTTATMNVGAGASLQSSGGPINATRINGVAITGVPANGQIPVAQNGVSAVWGSSSAVQLQTNGAPNGLQTVLDNVAGAGMTVSDDGAGNITFSNAGVLTLNGLLGFIMLLAGANLSLSIAGNNIIVSFVWNATSQNANYAAALGDLVISDTSAGGFTVTLPDATSSARRMVSVQKNSTDGNTLTIAPSGADTVSGGPSATIAVPKTVLTFVAFGTDWVIV